MDPGGSLGNSRGRIPGGVGSMSGVLKEFELGKADAMPYCDQSNTSDKA